MSRTRIVLAAACVLLLSSVLSADDKDPTEEIKQLYSQAQEAAKTRKFDQSVAFVKQALKLSPKNDQLLASLSDYERQAGKYADGVEHALQAIKLNDKVALYYVLVAANAYGNQDPDLAREYCDIVIKREKEFGSGSANDAKVIRSALAPKTYTLFWTLDPQKIRYRGGPLLIAVPTTELSYQTVTYEVNGAQSNRFIKGEANDLLQVVPQGGKPFKFTTKITVQPYSFKKDLAKATTTPLPAEIKTYLGSCETINVKSPALMKVAAELKGDNSVETVRNILAWMKKNVEYKVQKSSIAELDFKSVDEIIKRGHGECRGYSMLFTALCRAADVPARPVWGLLRINTGPEGRTADVGSHNWAEFYISGCGWVPVDPQKPESIGFLPTTYMRVFMDARKSRASQETLPMIQLMYMNGEKLKFEEAP